MTQLQRLTTVLEMTDATIAHKQEQVFAMQKEVNQLQNEKKNLKEEIQKEKDKAAPKLGDIYSYKGFVNCTKMIVANFGEPKDPLYCLICLNGCDKGKRWSTPEKDINKIWGLQKANEFVKVEE